MAPNRYYSSTATPTTVVGPLTNSAPTINVVTVAGYPTSFPYTGLIDRGLVSEEAVTVTSAAGTALTCTRGVDGTSAVSHTSGATFEHGITARDFQEPQNHIGATSNVHGVTGQVVGDTDTQDLLNKTLESPQINTPTVTGGVFSASPVLAQPVIADHTQATHDHHNAANGGLVPFASLTGAGTAYVPAWTSSGVAPVLGNGTLVGRYAQIGKLVFVWVKLTIGSTTTLGTGNYRFSVPFAESGAAGPSWRGEAYSSRSQLGGTVRLDVGSGSACAVTFPSVNTTGTGVIFGQAAGSVGQNLVAGDIVDLSLVYEAA